MLFEDFHTPITQSFYQIGKQYEKSPLSYSNAVNDIYPGFAVNNRYSRLKLGLLDKETKDSQAISIKFLYFEHYYKKAAIEILKILYFNYMIYKFFVTLGYIFFLSKIYDEE